MADLDPPIASVGTIGSQTELFVKLLADVTGFQTVTGAPTAAAAAGFIYYPWLPVFEENLDKIERPFAIVESGLVTWEGLGEYDLWPTEGEVGLILSDWEHHERLDYAQRIFEQFVDGVLNGIRARQGRPIKFSKVHMELPIGRSHPRDDPSQRPYWMTAFAFSWSGR